MKGVLFVRKIYIPVMAAMLATPFNSVANAEELPKTDTAVEEIVVEP